MNQQTQVATPEMPAEIMQPAVVTAQELVDGPAYYERRITFAPTEYQSNANYENAPAVALGETATRVVATAKPAEGSYVKATSADLKVAYNAYLLIHESQQMTAMHELFARAEKEKEDEDKELALV